MLIFFCFGDPALSQPTLVRSVILPNGAPFTHYQLQNGLQVYIVENHSAPVLAYQTWIKVGSREEKIDPKLNATGLAHLFEHLMFRGTRNHPDGEFDRILARSGAVDENATTDLDRTNYFESVPARYLELVAGLEADRMANLVLDRRLLEIEKGAVLGELHMLLDDPDHVAMDRLYSEAFTVHPYRWSTIGTEEEIRAVQVEDAAYFYQRYYAPNNAAILIVGDVHPAHAAEIVQQRYGGLQSQAIDLPPAPPEPAQQAERQVEFRHPRLTGVKVWVGYHSPEARNSDQAPLWVVFALLTQGEGAILRDAWVNHGIAVSLDGKMDQLRDPGLMMIEAELQSGRHPAELLGILDRALFLLKSGPQPRDLERAKNQLLASIYRRWDENSSFADFLGEFIISTGDPLSAFNWVSAIEQVTSHDVTRVVELYLDSSHRTTVIGRPQKGDPS